MTKWCSWHLVGRAHKCCSTSYNKHRTAPTIKNYLVLNVNYTEVKKLPKTKGCSDLPNKALKASKGPDYFLFKKFIYLFYFYLFLATSGVCCCTQAFTSCGERGLLFVAVHGLLIVVASLVAEHGL